MSAYKVAIVGPKSIISGFKALGVKPFNAETSEEALSVLQDLKERITNEEESERFATVIVIESLAEGIAKDDMEKVSRGALPAIVLLPGVEGSRGIGIQKLQKLAEKAVGSDVLS